MSDNLMAQVLDLATNGPEYAAKAIREQRRYEIAKEVVAAIVCGEASDQECVITSPAYAAIDGVRYADALLAELEKKP